jgi:hypothetical protein
MKYYLHGSAGINLHAEFTKLEKAKKYADSLNYKATVSTLHAGKSPWNGKPTKEFKQVYTNGK